MPTRYTILLAGGMGTRMGWGTLKQLVPINGKPLIGRQLDYVLPQVDRVIIILAYKANEIIEYVSSHYQKDKVLFSVGKVSLDIGGALKRVLLNYDVGEFVVALNYDDFTDIDIRHLYSYREHVLCIAHPRLPFGRVIEKGGYVTQFEEKPVLNTEWVSCGWYLFQTQDVLKHLPDEGSLEREVLPKLKMHVHKHYGFWKPVDTKKAVAEIEILGTPSKPLSPQVVQL